MAGIAVAAAAYAGKYSIQAFQAFKARPPKASLRRFYDGGFHPVMTRREASLILGIRCVNILCCGIHVHFCGIGRNCSLRFFEMYK